MVSVWIFRGLTILLLIIIFAVAFVKVSTWDDVQRLLPEEKGDALPEPVQVFFKVLFGGGLAPEMLYTYTFVPFVLLPLIGAFILIYFLAQNILPHNFAGVLAIIVVFITSYSGFFLRFVFGTLTFFGWYGYIIVWIVLILSSTAWGIGQIGGSFAGIGRALGEYERKKHEKEKKCIALRKYIDELDKMIARTFKGTEEHMALMEKRADAVKELTENMQEITKLSEKEANEVRKQAKKKKIGRF